MRFRHRVKVYETPSIDERRRVRENLEQVMDGEGEAYPPPQPVPAWPDVAPEQDRWCPSCRHRCIHEVCWACRGRTWVRQPGAGRPDVLKGTPRG